jgi:hypothetical protein
VLYPCSLLPSFFLLHLLAQPAKEGDVEINPGADAYRSAIGLLNDLTLQQILLDLKARCALAPWESAQLASLQERLQGKRLVERTVHVVSPIIKAWTGPNEFVYFDPAIDSNVSTTLIPPLGERNSRSWEQEIYQEGGVVVFLETPRGPNHTENILVYKDILVGAAYASAALRTLECGPREVRLRIIGDEMAVTERPAIPPHMPVSAWYFDDRWLGKPVLKGIVLPLLGRPFSRWRLNPSTGEPEFVEYHPDRWYLISRIVSRDSIQEIHYDSDSIEVKREIFSNIGSFEAGAISLPKKGPLIRASQTTDLFPAREPGQSVIIRKWRWPDGRTKIERRGAGPWPLKASTEEEAIKSPSGIVIHYAK